MESEYPEAGPGVCRSDKHTAAVELLPYTWQLWQPWVQRAGRNPQDVSKPRTNPQRRPQRGQQTSFSQKERGLPEWLMGTSLVVQNLRIRLTVQGTLGDPWPRKIPQALE